VHVPRRGCARCVDLDTAVAERGAVDELGAGEEPLGVGRVADDPRAAMLAAVVRAVLGAQQRRFRRVEVAPLGGALDRVSVPDGLPEEVVRREEREVAAEVPVPAYERVLVRRHVLVMAREDD
jgi:hypothetical protein